MVESKRAGEQWLLIACTLRSGSNYLCKAIEGLGLSKPTEYFQESRYRNPSNPLRMDEQEGLPSAVELYASCKRQQAGRKWTGVKWNWTQFQTVRTELANLGAPGASYFPKPTWIKLTRRNLAEQAVSLYVAQRSGVWVSGDIPKLDCELEYDFEEVHAALDEIVHEEALWERFFREEGIEPLRLYYEDFIKDPFGQVGALLGIDIDPEAAGTTTSEPTTTDANRAILAEFEGDILSGAASRRLQKSSEILAKVGALAEGVGYGNVLGRFLAHPPGVFPVIRKIDLRQHEGFTGQVDVLEADHFRDRFGVRMSPDSTFEITLQARSLLLELLTHPWSGYAEIQIDAEEQAEVVDLYHHTTSFRPILRTWPETKQRTLRLKPLPRQNELALGSEVWLQRLWAMS
jgi:LPS sulfotransferase NodH